MSDQGIVLNETKSPLLSKTLWVNLVVALAALFFPPAGAFIQSHPEVVLVVFSGVNMLLRLITKKEISLLQ